MGEIQYLLKKAQKYHQKSKDYAGRSVEYSLRALNELGDVRECINRSIREYYITSISLSFEGDSSFIIEFTPVEHNSYSMNDLRKIVISTEDIVTRDDLYIAFLKKLQCNCTEEEKNRIDNLIKFEEVRDGDGREA